MKITTMVRMPDQEIEVDIDGNDIVAAMLGETEGYAPDQLIRRAFNNIGAFMQKMPDEAIVRLGPECRNLISNFCLAQASRFKV
jgi:hypothetical protein